MIGKIHCCISILALLAPCLPLSAEFDYIPEDDRVSVDAPWEPVPTLVPSDRIGWSADGNNNDPDDWAATPVAIVAFAAAGLADQVVHFSYNNRLDQFDTVKRAEQTESTIGAGTRFGYDMSNFYDLWDPTEYAAAFESAVQEVLASGPGNRFFWVQAGPFEFAYRVLQEAAVNRGATADNLKYTILVSHSGINERPDKWTEIDAVSGNERPAAGAQMCVEEFGAGFFFTGRQYRERFGAKRYDEGWEMVQWMEDSEHEPFRWVHSRFRVFSDFHQSERPDQTGLDASDGGMAFTLITGNYDGNLELWSDLVRGYFDVAYQSYESWVASYNLTGEDALRTANPDNSLRGFN